MHLLAPCTAHQTWQRRRLCACGPCCHQLPPPLQLGTQHSSSAAHSNTTQQNAQTLSNSAAATSTFLVDSSTTQQLDLESQTLDRAPCAFDSPSKHTLPTFPPSGPHTLSFDVTQTQTHTAPYCKQRANTFIVQANTCPSLPDALPLPPCPCPRKPTRVRSIATFVPVEALVLMSATSCS